MACEVVALVVQLDTCMMHSALYFGARLKWRGSSACLNRLLVRSVGDESIKDEKFGAKVLRFISG